MKRNLQLDFWRGVLLLIIVIDHSFSEQNIIRQFTDGFIGWASAAEGFVLLSGLTAGLVYTYKFSKQDDKVVMMSALKRSWTIYKYHISLLLICLLLLGLSPLHKSFWIEHYHLIYEQPILSLSSFAALLYQPRYFDILPMYALFLLFVPSVIKQFKKGNQRQVLALSAIAYLAGTFNVFSFLFKALGPTSQVYFNLFSWQLLFFAGLYCGFLMYQGKVKIHRFYKFFYAALGVTVIMFLLKTFNIEPETHFFSRWTDKGDLRPLRLLNVASIVIVIACITARFKRFFTFSPVCVLGKYSLEVYSVHIVLIILFQPVRVYLNGASSIMISESTYIFPYTSLILFFVMIPALYALPFLKKKFRKS